MTQTTIAATSSKTADNRPVDFTPWTFFGFVVMLGAPLILWVLLLDAVMPDEVIPRVENLPDGSRSYHLHELAAAILGATCLPVLGISGFFVVRALKNWLQRHGVEPKKTAWRTEPRWGIAILAIGALALLWLVIMSVAVSPFTNLRTVITRPDTIEFHSLYWRWTIGRDDVERASITQNLRRARGGPRYDVHLVVTTKSGETYRTMASRWEIPDGVEPEDLPDHLRVLEALKADIAP
jgi:hypothetical protein